MDLSCCHGLVFDAAGNNEELACFEPHHLLSQVKYTDVPHKAVKLPPREHSPDYRREPINPKMVVPEVY